MSQEKHRLGVSKNNLVTRRIKMTQPDEPALHTAMAEIDEMFGLDKIHFDQRKQVLSISYDAGKLGIDYFIIPVPEIEVYFDGVENGHIQY